MDTWRARIPGGKAKYFKAKTRRDAQQQAMAWYRSAVEAQASVGALGVTALLEVWQESRRHLSANQQRMDRIIARSAAEHFADTDAQALSPRDVKRWLEQLSGRYQRDTCNRFLRGLKQAYAHAVSEEMIDESAFVRLQAVKGLRYGQAEEPRPVEPVMEDQVASTLLWMCGRHRCMVTFMLLTGCRPGEMQRFDWRDVETNREPWIYRPRDHKTAHRGHRREIFIGPRCREMMTMFRDTPRPFDSHLSSLRAAVRTAAARAGVAPWRLNQVRHLTATRLREADGIEVAQFVLGHRSMDMTTRYSWKANQIAAPVIEEIG
ncbi:MAG: site-specific integrase [Gammaproteobacteria bacterium]|nr:site-specific integrase [Gammaproteobacteria bacterium]